MHQRPPAPPPSPGPGAASGLFDPGRSTAGRADGDHRRRRRGRISALGTLLLALGLPSLVPGCDRPEPRRDAADPSRPSGPDAPADPTESADGRRLRPDLAPLYRLILERQTGPARVRLRKLVDGDPADGQARFLFGLSYHRERRYGEAEPWFEEAMALAPEFHLAGYFLAWGHYYRGLPSEAEAGWRRVLEVEPDLADAHFGIGLVALEDGRLDEAAGRFERAIALGRAAGEDADRETAKALARLADVRTAEGDHVAARPLLEEAVALWPDHYEAWFKLARTYTRLGLDDLAEQARTTSIATRERLRPGTSFPE